MPKVAIQKFVMQHQNPIGLMLGALVMLTLAFDYFVGFGGANLIGLRLVYLMLMSLLVAYIYTLGSNNK